MSQPLRTRTLALVAEADAILAAFQPRQRVFAGMEQPNRILSREEAAEAFRRLRLHLLSLPKR